MNDKEFKKQYFEKIIVGDAKKEAETLFKEIRDIKSFYKANAVLGKLLSRFYTDKHEEDAIDFIVDFLYRKYKFDEQETNHVHIIFQYLFDILGARVYEDKEYQEIKSKFEDVQ
jgi:hypothetical protein